MSDPKPQAETEVERLWRSMFTDPENPAFRHARRARSFWKHVPGDPRCKMCAVPFRGVATPVLRLTNKTPAAGNPRYCNKCEIWTQQNPGGAEIELSLLFADVRGSTGLAEELGPAEFARLMQRFYQAANSVLIESDAWMEKPVGDEIIATYTPVFAGNHAARAIEGATNLLEALGYGTSDGPWIEVGGGVHTGIAFIGTVGVEGSGRYDVSVLGDAVNVTARLASLAGPGEMLISEDSLRASAADLDDLPRREVEIRGREAPLRVGVLTGAPSRI